MLTKLKHPRLSLQLVIQQTHSDHQWRRRLYKSSFNSWAFSIKKASSSSSPLKALHLYTRMHRQSVPFDTFSILFALKSCTNSPQNLTAVVRHLHAHSLKLGFSAHVFVATSLLSAYVSTSFNDACKVFDEMPHRNTVTHNIMVTAYSRQGDIKTARMLFDKMPERDLASWSTMIAAYMDSSQCDHMLKLFREMISKNDECLKPDQLTLGPILSGLGKKGSIGGLVLGKSIHGFIVKNNWELNAQIGTCLVDMYAKCGLLKNACLVFKMMSGTNVVAWTTLICGAAQHGYGQEALEMFNKMREANVMPNELTFTGLLTACAQAGLVDEGRGYFKLLMEYGMRPTIQHYGCMIDLLGKAGLIGEAYEVIRAMPFETNVVIWGSFLSSCKLHREFEMAEKVIGEVVRVIRPENDGGVYSIVADLYALSGKWSEMERLREMMVGQNVRKVRGSSLV